MDDIDPRAELAYKLLARGAKLDKVLNEMVSFVPREAKKEPERSARSVMRERFRRGL